MGDAAVALMVESAVTTLNENENLWVLIVGSDKWFQVKHIETIEVSHSDDLLVAFQLSSDGTEITVPAGNLLATRSNR